MDTVNGLCFNRLKDSLRINIPDGSNIGPVLPTCGENQKVKNIKNIRKQFGYSNSTLTIPIYCNPLHSSFKVNEYSNIYKSLIKVFNIEDKNYIAYTKPSFSGSASTFSISELSKKSNKECYVLKRTQDVQNMPIPTGIDISVFDSEAFALLLAEDEFEIIKVPASKPVIKSKTKRKIADASLHKMLKNYFTIIESEGTIHVFNCDRKVPCWSKNLPLKSLEDNSFLRCQFGYHPLSVFVTGSENIVSLDTRMDTNSGNSLVFSLCNIGSSFEQKIYSTNFNQNPYMYVNCTNSTYLVDERYSKVPVMTWNHLLPSGPNYSDLISMGSENILALATPSDKQVCFISTNAYELGSTQLYIPNTCLPRHFYTIEDTLSNMNANSMWYHSTIKERFASAWLGFTVSDIQAKICLLVQNSYGDLMYNIFTPGEEEENNLQSVFSDEEKRAFEKYEKCVLKNEKVKDNLQYCKVKAPSTLKQRNCINKKRTTIHINKNTEDVFWKIQDVIEVKKRSKCQIPLVSSYKSENIKSPKDSIRHFLNYKNTIINTLDDSSSKSLKNKLVSIWKGMPKESLQEHNSSFVPIDDSMGQFQSVDSIDQFQSVLDRNYNCDDITKFDQIIDSINTTIIKKETKPDVKNIEVGSVFQDLKHRRKSGF